jgi:hypothetical protein
MFLSYDKKYGNLYAKIVTSTRQGQKVHKEYTCLGLVLDKEKGIYRNRKYGIFRYDIATNTYDFNPGLDETVIAKIQKLKPEKKKTQKEETAYAQGKLEERNRINRLNATLIENNRYEDLKRSLIDETYQSKLLEEVVL